MNLNTKVKYKEYYEGTPTASNIDLNKIFLSHYTMSTKTMSFIFNKLPNRIILFNPIMYTTYIPLNKMLHKLNDKSKSFPKHFDIFIDYDEFNYNYDCDRLDLISGNIKDIITNIYLNILKYVESHPKSQIPKINIYILTKDKSRGWCKHDRIKFRNMIIPKLYSYLKERDFKTKYFHIESCRWFTANDKNSGYEIHINKNKYDGILYATIERDVTHIRKEDN